MSRNYTIRLKLIILNFIIISGLYSQQDPQYSLFMFNRYMINPAYAGADDALSVTADVRSQWVGIDGHPNTFTLNAHKPIPFLRGGLGLSVMGDYIGPFQTIDLKLAYAFHLPIGDKGTKLQLGLRGGMFNKVLDGTNWRPPQSNTDPILLNSVVNVWKPDLSAGIYLRGARDKFYIGIGGLHLLEPSLAELTNGGTGAVKIWRSFNGIAGYRFDISESVKLTPNAYFRMVGSQFQADGNLNLEVSPLVLGISYRLQDAVIGLIGFRASERLFVAYSYDYTLSGLNGATSGSHELIVSYIFPSVMKFYPPNLGVRDKKTFR